MKKRFLTIAIAASFAAPLSAIAGDATLYGRAHMSLDHIEPDAVSASTNGSSLDFNDRKSAIGVKGKEDLGGGMTAFFKMEWSVDMTGNSGIGIGTRDRYIGLKTGMGTVKMGAMTTSWKQTTAWIDPFWHTIAEGRGDGQVASELADSRGLDRGRGTHTLQYRSPKMGGMQMVINRTFSGNQNGENTGLGLRYTTKDLKAYFDYVNIANSPSGLFNTGAPAGSGETATKIGGSYKMGGTTVSLQLEQTEDLEDADYMLLGVKQKLNDNDTILFSYGTKDAVDNVTRAEDKDASHASFALGYDHKMSKRTNVYALYGSKSDDGAGTNDGDSLSFGIKHKF